MMRLPQANLKYIVSIAVIFLLLGALPLYSQNILEPDHSDNDSIPHYPDDQQPVIPNDVPADLDASFPKPGAIFPSLGSGKYFKWKEDLYKRHGIKLGFSYQAMVMGWPQSHAVSEESKTSAAGGNYLVEFQWKLFNRDKDYEGSITVAWDGRHDFGGIMPAVETFPETGSLYGQDATFIRWDPYVAILFWEQHLKKDRFWFRIGNISSAGILDFFRYKDGRVSFTSPPVSALSVHVIPYSVPSLGAAFKWNPKAGSQLYISGAVQDINNTVGNFDWSPLFDYGEIFAGLEIGKHWFRGPGDFDHAHLMIFYSDKISSAGTTIQDQFIPIPTKAGWGFKVHGTKQWNKIVAFANYTYNTVEGGIGGIFAQTRQQFNVGLARVQPFNVQGELGLALMFSDPNPERMRMINNPENPSEFILSSVYGGQARDQNQFATELYWRILVLPDLWVTPGMQLVVNPTYNSRSDVVYVPYIKARAFF